MNPGKQSNLTGEGGGGRQEDEIGTYNRKMGHPIMIMIMIIIKIKTS